MKRLFHWIFGLSIAALILIFFSWLFCFYFKFDFCGDIYKVLKYWDLIFGGFLITMWLYMWALIIGFFLGLMLSLMRHYGDLSLRNKYGQHGLRLLKWISTGYIEVIRGTPLLAQLLLIYFIPFSLNIPIGTWKIETSFRILDKEITLILLNQRTLVAILTLGLNSAAYQAEYLRGSIISVGSEQLIAAQSLGMSRPTGILHIVLPQALRRVIPAWSNEASYLPKYTVVVYFIGVVELFAQAYTITSYTFRALITYFIVALIFLATISVISKTLDMLYKRTSIPGV
jgi:polar amino acid transport system permease protein